ncbi:trypsin-like peptidase domain-containing protein [Thalassotalea sp. LPB0316]|uniref:S1C family serine protease n=1 Tax=Thalassotalea sp. LPB0316 TaxID=2769490 RepID=UPI0018665924|nr:trypsin-like peptidase domain-containing protein [Thalassotalea sp. LPB0316]QOL26849.1 trypsin-like peptidase domain-containing protein [Thalassotalea sp. LPB0316]
MFKSMFTLLLIVFSVSSVAQTSIQKIYKKANPGVVELHVEALAEPEVNKVEYQVKTGNSLGSGALIDKKGRIVTAAHVVERATNIKVKFASGFQTTGHVVWVAPLVDLAMIQVAEMPKNDFKVLKLAPRKSYEVGEQVVVIGAPYGVSHSLSVGYLSGIRDKGQIPLTDLTPRFLQTDAAINQGNSGGPMFNMKGEIIGIVSHILSQSGGSQGLGFVVSTDTVQDVIASKPPMWVGIVPVMLDKKLSNALNNPFGYGLLIQQVIPKTLAEKLGFQGGTLSVGVGQDTLLLGGDILVKAGHTKLDSIESLFEVQDWFRDLKKGEKVRFKFVREGRILDVDWIVD